MTRSAMIVALMLFCATIVHAGERVVIRGRDVLLDGQLYLPHGIVHASADQFPVIRKLGINSVHIDLPFRKFDPQRSDQENLAAFSPFLKMADEAHRHGQTVIWLLSFHYTPDWLWQR